MNLLNKIRICWKATCGIVLKRRSPLMAVLHVTHRCNLRCKYCGFYERKTGELETQVLCSFINEFYQSGVRFIVISGGEPLLRSDIGDIIKFCKMKQMFVSMNSNGLLVKDKLGEINNIDSLKLSLDGPKEINDLIKGQGVYKKVIEALEMCKKEGLKVSVTTVISRYNANIYSMSHILDIAKEYGIGVCFQPADQTHCGNIEKDISLVLPRENDFKDVVTYLIKEKSLGRSLIVNSLAALNHLYHWPCPQEIPCLVNLFSTYVAPDGKIFICDMFPGAQNFMVPAGLTLKSALKNLRLPHPCQHCWSGASIDFNLLARFNLNRAKAFWNKL